MVQICPRTMRECTTASMCSPYGGCSTDADDNRVAILERQIAELRAELAKAEETWAKAASNGIADFNRAEAAEAENARLRALPLKEVGPEVIPAGISGDIFDNDYARDVLHIQPIASLPLKDEVGRKVSIEALEHGKNLLLIAEAIEAERFASIVPHECARQLRAADEYLVSGSRLRAGEQEGWRPMETAPYDGTKFLAFESGRYFDCWWHDAGYGEAYWMDEANSEPSPNYWRPLPAAPSEQGGDRG